MPFSKKIRLARDNFLADLEDRVVPLVDALDEEIAVTNLTAYVFAHVLGILRLHQQILVGITDA